ncbi:MAG TPA: DUF4388 domain-containing protein [Vicinamibacteria bacterium]|jgi:hypothetical protein
MALKGTLRDFALPDIFQLIGMQRKTGMLTLENDRETVIVVFETGKVVHADSTVRRLDDLLGNVLVRQGKLKKGDLEAVLARQKVSMQRLGYILTNQGYIASQDLKEALSEQVQQIVFRIFRWKDGHYNFDPSNEVDYDRQNVIPVTADHILMEGIRRVDEWPIIEKRIPSLDIAFRQLVPKNQIQVREDGGDEASGLDAALGGLSGAGSALPDKGGRGGGTLVMTPQEARVYSHVNPKNSVETIVELTGMGDFDVCRIMFDFIDRNLIAPAGQPMEALAEPELVETGAPAASALGGLLTAAVIVLSLVGLFFSGGAPFRVPTRAGVFAGGKAELERGISLARMQKLDNALRTFFLTYAARPASLEVLASETPPLAIPADLRDARGSLFVYEQNAGSVHIIATNESGEPNLIYLQEVIVGDSAAPLE